MTVEQKPFWKYFVATNKIMKQNMFVINSCTASRALNVYNGSLIPRDYSHNIRSKVFSDFVSSGNCGLCGILCQLVEEHLWFRCPEGAPVWQEPHQCQTGCHAWRWGSIHQEKVISSVLCRLKIIIIESTQEGAMVCFNLWTELFYSVQSNTDIFHINP